MPHFRRSSCPSTELAERRGVFALVEISSAVGLMNCPDMVETGMAVGFLKKLDEEMLLSGAVRRLIATRHVRPDRELGPDQFGVVLTGFEPFYPDVLIGMHASSMPGGEEISFRDLDHGSPKELHCLPMLFAPNAQ
jgi:hypothetical protein